MWGRMVEPRDTALPPNIIKDQKTVAAMVRIYCRDHHGASGRTLCAECAELLGYADDRLAACPFEEEKTTCRDCPIHCYRAAERATMKDVMRYAGPRMLLRHPLLAIRHLWMERKGAPPWPPVKRRKKRHLPV
jgi:hypothetical protein